MPSVAGAITAALCRRCAKAEAARKVQAEPEQVLNSEMHRGCVGKITPAERELRRKAAEEFKKRYAQ